MLIDAGRYLKEGCISLRELEAARLILWQAEIDDALPLYASTHGICAWRGISNASDQNERVIMGAYLTKEK